MKRILTIAMLFAAVFTSSSAIANAPTSRPTTAPAVRFVNQAPNHFLCDVPAGATFALSDTHVSTGGVIHSNQGAKSIIVENVWSDKQPSGGGVYQFLIATKPVDLFVLDNTQRRKTNPNDDDFVNGGEASIRVMGGAKHVRIINVNLRNRKHDFFDPTGILQGTPFVPQTWWKQVLQIRDGEDLEYTGGRVIGLTDIGEQKKTALAPQHVGTVIFDGVQMTSMPSITDHKTVGKIVIRNCIKIDERGKIIGKWADKTL